MQVFPDFFSCRLQTHSKEAVWKQCAGKLSLQPYYGPVAQLDRATAF